MKSVTVAKLWWSSLEFLLSLALVTPKPIMDFLVELLESAVKLFLGSNDVKSRSPKDWLNSIISCFLPQTFKSLSSYLPLAVSSFLFRYDTKQLRTSFLTSCAWSSRPAVRKSFSMLSRYFWTSSIGYATKMIE